MMMVLYCYNVGVTAREHVRNSPECPESIQLQQLPKGANPTTGEGKENQPQDHILKSKLALSVSRVIDVNPLVKTLDKSRQALHEEENYKSTCYQNFYKDTLTLIQSQVLAAQNKLAKEIEDWETKFVIKHGFVQTMNTTHQKQPSRLHTKNRN